MEEDGEQTPRTPFWVQSTTNVHRIEVYRRRISSFFNSGVLIIFLLFLAIISMAFIIPTLISFTSQIFKPNFAKKSWDSINLILVLFALAFGFLSKTINNINDNDINNNNNNNSNNYRNNNEELRSGLLTGAPVSSPLTGNQSQWYDFPDQPIVGLRRHSRGSSYPDLRELSPPWNQRRFSDDTHLNYDRYYFREDVHKNDSFARPSPAVVEDVSHSPEPLPLCPPSTPPQPVDLIKSYHTVGLDDGEKGGSLKINKVVLPEKETVLPENKDSGNREEKGRRKRGKGERLRARSTEPRKRVTSYEPDPELELLSPVMILPEIQDSDQKTGKIERKRSGANATKDFFSSFYQKKKKKRQRQRSVDNLDTFLHHSQPPVQIQLPPPATPPPPPPPPPPPSILNNLFTSKKERRKKTSTPTPPPPPPPPTVARAQTFTSKAARAPRPTTSTTRVPPFVTEKPRVPVKMSLFNGIDDGSSGGESPMNRIPQPPPMPPFKMPDWKFAVEGDYVRVQSTLSSGSGSPDGDESRSPSFAVGSPAFCPSPDVDTKADTFIARFRAGLKLEKINSFNQNQSNRMSNLGPGPSHSNRF